MNLSENFRFQDRGMTLIEAMAWIAVFLFAMVSLTAALLSFYRTNRAAIAEASAVAQAQAGMDTAVRAIRIASYSSSGAYPVVSIAPQQFTFYANVAPGDNQIQEVRLYVSGTSLYESTVEPSGDPPSYSASPVVSDLADGVQNVAIGTSTFSYYDQNGAAITDYSRFPDARFVVVNLVVSGATTSASSAVTLRSSAAMRNLIGN